MNKNKNVCIITLYGNFNYGNKLQNYALQYAMEKKGYNVSSLKISMMPSFSRRVYYKIKNILGINKPGPSYPLRTKNFGEFNKYIQYTDFLYREKKHNAKLSEFDKLVIGSDQVWNHWGNEIPDVMFGLGIDSSKVMSYSASFGVSNINSKFVSKYKKGLKNVSSISVRETAGKEIVKSLINKDVPVVLDPTLLLSTDEWINIEKKPEFKIPEKYILTYFLGGISETRRNEMEEFAKKENLEIVDLQDLNAKEYYNAGPSEFVYLFHNASLVLTDSFHACIFSYTFDVPFGVYSRENTSSKMGSRIDTLLEIFNMPERHIKSINDINILNINYKMAKENIAKLKEESLEFLYNSLEK